MIALFVLLGILMLATLYLISKYSAKRSTHYAEKEPKKLPKGK